MYQTQYVPAKTSHILHLLLTLFTFGFWSPVWFFVWLYNHNRTVPRTTWVQMPVNAPYGYGYPQGQAPVYPSAANQALQMALPPVPPQVP